MWPGVSNRSGAMGLGPGFFSRIIYILFQLPCHTYENPVVS